MICFPIKSTVPLSGLAVPPRIASNVDFPLPDMPVMAQISFSWKSALKWSSTIKGGSDANDFTRFRHERIAVIVDPLSPKCYACCFAPV